MDGHCGWHSTLEARGGRAEFCVVLLYNTDVTAGKRAVLGIGLGAECGCEANWGNLHHQGGRGHPPQCKSSPNPSIVWMNFTGTPLAADVNKRCYEISVFREHIDVNGTV